MAHFSCIICDQKGEFGTEQPNVTCTSWKTTTAPCPNCIQVKAMDEHIEEIQAYLRHLEAHRAALRCGANAFHDPFTMLLPTEIGSKILSFCVDGENGVERRIPLALSAVSKRWQSIAHSTALLWASICLRLDSDPRSRRYSYEDMLLDWLQRSSQYPLSIYLRVNAAQYLNDVLENQCRSIIKILNAHCHRWGKLSVEMPLHLLGLLRGNFIGKPLLSHLRIRGDDLDDDDDDDSQIRKFDLGTSLPAPHTVSISRCRPHSIHINWCNVTNLSLGFPRLYEFLALLKAAPLLRECRVGGLLREVQAAGDHQDITVVHRNLIKFHVEIWESRISPLFNALCFPNLDSLVYEGSSPTMTPLSTFFIRSSCPIKSLAIRLDPGCDHRAELFDILWAVPTLERLEISGTCVFDNFFKLLAADEGGLEEQRFLPSLMEYCENRPRWVGMFAWQDISRAVGARASLHRAKSGLPLLKQFSWVIDVEKSRDVYYIDEGSLRIFEKLLTSGVDIKISNRWRKPASMDDIISYSRAYHEEQKRWSTSNN